MALGMFCSSRKRGNLGEVVILRFALEARGSVIIPKNSFFATAANAAKIVRPSVYEIMVFPSSVSYPELSPFG